MNIAGIQKLSLVDFDGVASATIFTYGCNFRCPFCHNGELVTKSQQNAISEDEVLNFLSNRKKLLDGVCVTGGEPTMQKDLVDFIAKIRKIGYLIKLDTNGTNPAMLEELIDKNLINYVAMDIKNTFEKYPLTVGVQNLDTQNIRDSVEILNKNKVAFEFRTTIIKEFHNDKDITGLAKIVKFATKYFLQKYVDNDNCITKGFTAVEVEKAKEYLELLKNNGVNAFLRGYDL